MQRLLVLLIALGLVATVGLGQLSIVTSLKGGLSSATFKGDDIQGNEAISQFAVGMAIELDLPGSFSIQPEILYSLKGTRVAGAVPPSQLINLAYVDIPLLVKFSFPVPVLNPSVYVGPSIGILLSAKGKSEGAIPPTPDQDLKGDFARTDYGVVIGAGILVPLLITDVSIEARYYHGLNKLDKDGTLKQYNRVISLLAGITL